MSRRLRRVPLPLALLLAVAAVEACAWIVLIPALQGPDEVSHFAYVQKLAEHKSIPWNLSGESKNPGGAYSSEVNAALYGAGLGPLAANVSARPLWTKADEGIWRKDAANADRGNGGFTSALKNPPAYYLYEAVPYEVFSHGSFFDRQFAMRVANIPLFLAAIVFTWLLAGEMLGRGWAQYVAAAWAALVPQLLNLVATVNPDILLVAEWSAAFWLMALLLRRGPRRALVAWLAVVCVLSALTQGRGLPLLLPAGMAVLLAVARERGWRAVTPLRVGAAAAIVFAPIVLIWAGKGPKGYVREFVSYLWQFYLPKLSFMHPAIGPRDYHIQKAFTNRLWGAFAQLEVVLPNDLADFLYKASLAGLVLLVVALVVRRHAVRRHAALAVVLAAAVISLVVALHLIAYRSMIGFPGDPIITGRYLLPLVPLFGIAIAIVASAMPRPLRAAFSGVIVGGGVALQFVALGLILERFYA